MKKDELYLDELILVLILITVALTAFWYYSELNLSKIRTAEKINGLQKECISPEIRKSDCEITQKTYDFENEILCSPKLISTYSNFAERINSNNNLIEIKELMRPFTPLGLEGVYTLGEFANAKEFFKTTSETKLQILQVLGAIEGCEYRLAKMKSYATCDLLNAKSILRRQQNDVSGFYTAEAEKALNTGEYLKSIYYTSAAVAYSKGIARQAYADVIEASRTQGLVC